MRKQLRDVGGTVCRQARVQLRRADQCHDRGRALFQHAEILRTTSSPVAVGPGNLGKICELALAEIGALHPSEDLRWSPAGDLVGVLDSARLGELLVNLLGNAIDHTVRAG